MCDGACEGMITGAESLIDVEWGSVGQPLLNLLNGLLYLHHEMPHWTIVLQGLVAEGSAAGRVAVREALSSKLPSIVLVHGHKSACELAVLEEAVNVTIEA